LHAPEAALPLFILWIVGMAYAIVRIFIQVLEWIA